MPVTLADIKPSILSLVTFFFMWVLVSNLGKYLFVKTFQVPGLTPLVANA